MLHNDRIGPAVLPAGSYTIVNSPVGFTCNATSRLFTRFLGAGGALPPPWRVRAQTFYKPTNPQRSAFRVELSAPPALASRPGCNVLSPHKVDKTLHPKYD